MGRARSQPEKEALNSWLRELRGVHRSVCLEPLRTSGICQISISPTVCLITNFLEDQLLFSVVCNKGEEFLSLFCSSFYWLCVLLGLTQWQFQQMLIGGKINKLTPRILVGSAELFIARHPILIPVPCCLWGPGHYVMWILPPLWQLHKYSTCLLITKCVQYPCDYSSNREY